MWQVFDSDNITPDVPGIILLSHGPLARGCLETAKMLAGDAENLAAFSLEEGADLDEYTAAFMNAFNKMPEGTIFLVDLLGGTPCNQLMKASRTSEREICAATGMNVSLVLMAIDERGDVSGRELIETIIKPENNGISNVCELLDKMHK